MDCSYLHNMPMGWLFGILTKQYVGYLAKRLADTPVEKYFYPFFVIGKNDGKISQQQLADQLLMDKVSMVRIVDYLANLELIERVTNPEDRRQHLLAITPKGKPWIEEVQRAIQETDEVFLSLVTNGESTTFHNELIELSKHVFQLPVEEIELYYDKIHVKNENN